MALLPVSLSIGVLCGIWFQITVMQAWLIAWVGYAGWASFYYAGGNVEGIKKSLAANIAGMTQGAIFFFLWVKVGGGNFLALSAIIGVYCFVMTIEGNIPLLVTIPGQFVGAAVFFGNLGAHDGAIWVTLLSTLVCMTIGNFAGLLSAKLPELFTKKKEEAPA